MPHVTVPPVVQAPRRPAGGRLPSRRWYWAAGLLGGIGLAAAIWWAVGAVLGVTDHVEGYARTTIPGAVSVTVERPGLEYVYFEGSGNPSLADLRMAVTGPDGAPVVVRAYSLNLHYEALDRSGHVVGRFRADVAGRYRLEVSGTGVAGSIAVGDSFAPRLILPLVGAGLLVAVSGGLAVLTAVVVAIRRSAVVPRA